MKVKIPHRVVAEITGLSSKKDVVVFLTPYELKILFMKFKFRYKVLQGDK